MLVLAPRRHAPLFAPFAFVVPLLAQSPPTLLPLQEGVRHTYTESHEPARPAPTGVPELVVVDEGGFATPDGARIHRLRIEPAGQPTVFECWSLRPDGILQHPMRDALQRSSVAHEATPVRVVAVPVAAGAQWGWQGPALAGDPTRTQSWRASVVADDVAVRVPAGEFRTVHVQIVDGSSGTRDTWFAAGVGIVRDELRTPNGRRVRELLRREVGETRQERLARWLDEQLRNPAFPSFNNPPHADWIDAAPEAMVLPGRIAVVKAERWCRCVYVDDAGVQPFMPGEADRIAPAVRAAFGGDTAVPPPRVDVVWLARLLARTEAKRLLLDNARFVTPSLSPRRALPAARDRHAHVELEAGARDGTSRRVAVWLTVARSSEVQIASNADDPWARAK